MCHIDVKLGCTLFHDNRCQSQPRQAVKVNVRYVLMGYNVVLHVVVQAESLPTVLVHQVLGLVPTAAVSHQARKG